MNTLHTKEVHKSRDHLMWNPVTILLFFDHDCIQAISIITSSLVERIMSRIFDSRAGPMLSFYESLSARLAKNRKIKKSKFHNPSQLGFFDFKSGFAVIQKIEVTTKEKIEVDDKIKSKCNIHHEFISFFVS